VEDPQLGLGPVIRGELLLRGVNDPAGPSLKNGEVQSTESSGRGQLSTLICPNNACDTNLLK